MLEIFKDQTNQAMYLMEHADTIELSGAIRLFRAGW